MTNAKEELIEHIEGRPVEFVSIGFRKSYGEEPLKIKGSLVEVLSMLDFNYDSGYGSQELHGNIWYEDGTWSDRGEYGGAEWWQHQTVPCRDDDCV